VGFVENFPASFPVSCVNGLHEFLETGKGGQLGVVDHIIFDMFGQFTVSLSMECCIAILNTCD